MDARIKSGHDDRTCSQERWRNDGSFSMMTIIADTGNTVMDDDIAPKIEYGVTPAEVMASMAGVDFVRAMFDGRLPAPPIMQTIEPFDSTAEPGVVAMHSIPGFRHYKTIGAVDRGRAPRLLR